jgi:hypothetical protein
MALQIGSNLLGAIEAPLNTNKTFTTSPPKKCHLLSLPTELRFIIYSHVFGPHAWCNSDPEEWTPEYTSSDLARFRIASSKRHNYDLGAYDIFELDARFFLPGLTLLQTCKQVHAEGISVMYAALQIDVPVGAMYYFKDWMASIGKLARSWIASVHAAMVVDLSLSKLEYFPGSALTALANLLPLPSVLIVTLFLDNPDGDLTKTQEEQAALIDEAIVVSNGVGVFRHLEALNSLKRRGMRFRTRKRRMPEEDEMWAPAYGAGPVAFNPEVLSGMARRRAWFAVHIG